MSNHKASISSNPPGGNRPVHSKVVNFKAFRALSLTHQITDVRPVPKSGTRMEAFYYA